MNKLKAAVSLILIVVFLFTGSLGASAIEYGSYFDSMLQFMRGMYYKGLTDEEGLKAALKGMFAGLDKYSAFYDVEETEALNNSLSGNYVGIGAGLEKSDVVVKITKVYEGSPAEKAGIHEGDIIVAVDGNSIENLDVESVAASIRGDSGTTVRITILRGTTTKEYNLIRGTVTISSVQYRIEGNIAYIHIDSFSTGTGVKFNEAITQINNNNILKIILDLRGNPGGYVDEAVNVAKKLVPPGVITTLDYKTEEISDRVYRSSEKNPAYIIAVLVDEGSASASEILAGALEDAGNGILIGQKTYGKGVFQNMFSVLTPEAYVKYSKEYGAQYVSDIQWKSYYGVYPEKNEILGTAKITTGHYLTPKGRAIDGIGLEPVIQVPNRINPNGIDLSMVSPLNNTDSITLDSYNNDVYNVERFLKASGYFLDGPDRQYDTATIDAIKRFQAEVHLPLTGIIDTITRDSLNKSLIELRIKNDAQYTKAVEILSWFGN